MGNDDLFRDDDDFEFDDDFDFDGDDNSLFDDEGDDAAGGGFDFEDDDDVDFDDIDALDGFDDSDDLDFEEEEEESGGGNRTFIILALLMFLTFLCGIGVVLFLAFFQDDGPSDTALTATQIALENEGTIEAATQVAIVRATEAEEAEQTAAAEQTAVEFARQTEVPITETAEAELTQEAATVIALTEIALSATPTPLEVAVFDLPATQTAQAENIALTEQAAIALTEQAERDVPTETPPPPSEPLTGEQVALTATAIAQALIAGIPTPTPDETIGEPVPGLPDAPGTPPDAPEFLPETGLFDDMTSDQGLLMALALIFGLLGVIAVSRTVRAANSG